MQGREKVRECRPLTTRWAGPRAAKRGMGGSGRYLVSALLSQALATLAGGAPDAIALIDGPMVFEAQADTQQCSRFGCHNVAFNERACRRVHPFFFRR